MKKLLNIPDVDLTLFDGGAAAGGAGSGTAAGAAAPTGQSNTAGTQAQPESSQRAKKGKNEFSNVVYGKAPTGEEADGNKAPDAEGTDGKDEKAKPEDKSAKFRELINGEYKDVYTAETQKIIDRRFRDYKTLQETLDKYKAISDTLAAKYGIEDGDPDKLMEAIEKDNALWESAAEDAGMPVDKYREYQAMLRENRRNAELLRRVQQQQAVSNQMRVWNEQAEGMKEKYPDFDLVTESQNPEFLAALKAGMSIEKAYRAVHYEELMQKEIAAASKSTEKAVVDNIRAKGTRPAENGVSSQSGIVFKSDPSKLTKKDRAEIARRVAQGEKISF